MNPHLIRMSHPGPGARSTAHDPASSTAERDSHSTGDSLLFHSRQNNTFLK